jgi:hypothetical protein
MSLKEARARMAGDAPAPLNSWIAFRDSALAMKQPFGR